MMAGGGGFLGASAAKGAKKVAGASQLASKRKMGSIPKVQGFSEKSLSSKGGRK